MYQLGVRMAQAGLAKSSRDEWRSEGRDPADYAAYARGYRETFDAMSPAERKRAALTTMNEMIDEFFGFEALAKGPEDEAV